MNASKRILALFLLLSVLASAFPVKFAAASKLETVSLSTSTESYAELEATAAALKTEIASLADGKNRNGRVRLSGFKQSSDGKTDMINITGKHYLVRNQGDGRFFALNGAWTGTDDDLPTVSVTASDATNFYYIVSGISTTHAFNLIPAGTASNGMPAYNLQFNNGKYLGIGSQYTGTYTNLYHVKASTSKEKVRFEHGNGAGNFAIRNITGTHGFRQNDSITHYRWKDNSSGDNAYTGNVLYLYRLWTTTDLRAAIDEMKSYLDAPSFYNQKNYTAFLECMQESITLFKKYNVVPTKLIEPYDDIQATIDAQAAKLRDCASGLFFTIDGLDQSETTAQTCLYQLGSQEPRAEGDYDHSMSYIIKTRKGKIIIIDGGWERSNADGKYLFAYLREITGDMTPHVTAWFITHAHGDHHGAVATMANLYADKITVDAFYHHYPTDEQIEKYFTDCDVEATKAAVRRVPSMMKKLKNSKGGAVKEVKVNSIHSGLCNSSFDFDEVHIDILLDMNDIAYMADTVETKYSGTPELQGRTFSNKTLKELLTDNLNESSIVFRATVFGKSILFTGDAGFVAGKALNLYDSRNEKNPDTYYSIQSDYVQVSHHGYYGLAKDTYQKIAPSKALFPTPKWEWEENARVGYAAQWFTDMGATNYFSYKGPQIFRFSVNRSAAAVSIPAALKPYVFDAKYYADNNKDLKKAYGYDEEKLYWHFVNFGIEEGRCASPFFDVKFYINQNGQNFLDTMRGDYEKAFKHFLSNYNTTTMMKLSKIFDTGVYASLYKSLAEDGIDTVFELLQHFADKNYPRGKIATTTYPSANGTGMHTDCDVTQAVLPNCTAEGRTARIKCNTCKEILQETETLEKLPHSYDDGKITSEPTCTEEGVKTYTCTACSGTKTESVAATGHTPVADAAVDPSCSQVGWTEGSHCSVCQTVITAPQEVPVLPHSYEASTVEPSCTAGGYTTYTCTACGDTYCGDETAASGHIEAVVEGLAPTCTASGMTEGKFCSVCGEILAVQVEIPAIGHTYTLISVAPTCTERGYDFHFCACGDSYMDNEIAPLGHSYSYTDNGDDTHTATCACGDAITEAHAYVDGTCACGAVEIVEPILDSNISIGESLSLESDLTMNLRIKTAQLTNYDLSTIRLVVERDIYNSDGTITVETRTMTDYTIKDNRVVFAYTGISAAQMNDEIRAVLYIKDASGKEYMSKQKVTSVAIYSDLMLGVSAGNSKLITLIMDMLNYGTAAQRYYNRHADAPVNEAFDSFKTYASYASSDLSAALEDMSGTISNGNTSATITQGLDLSTRVGITYKVKLPAGVDAKDATLIVKDEDGKELESFNLSTGTLDTKGRYCVTYFGSTSREMRKMIYATVMVDGEPISATYTYTISSYAHTIANTAGMPDSLVNLTKLMVVYGDSAEAYFAG